MYHVETRLKDGILQLGFSDFFMLCAERMEQDHTIIESDQIRDK